MFILHFNDAVFIAKLVNFAVFIGCIVWVYLKLGKSALVVHQEAQNKIVADAQAYRERSKDVVETACQAIDQAKLDSVRMIDVGKAQAARLIESETAAAHEHAQRIRAHAAGELERERNRVRRELLEETVHRAHEQARDIAKHEIDARKQASLVEGLLHYLERSRA